MKKLLKTLAVVFVLLIVVVALLPTIAGGWIQSRTESALADGMDADVSIGDFSFGWMSGLEMKDLEIDGRKADAPDITVKSISAKPGLGALLGGDLVIEDARVDGVTVRSRAAAAKPSAPSRPKTDAPAPGPKKPAGSKKAAEPIELPVGLDVALVVTDLTVIREDAGWAAPLALRKIERIQAHVKSGEAMTFSVVDKDLKLDGRVSLFDGKAIRPTDAIEATAHLVAKATELSRYREAAAPWYEIAGGRLEADKQFVWKDGALKLNGTLGLTGLRLSDAARGVTHEFKAISVKSDLTTNPELEGQGTFGLAARGGSSTGIEGIDGPLAIGDIDLEASLEPGRKLHVAKAKVQGDLLRLDAGGDLSFGGDIPRGDFWLTLDSALEKLARFAAGREDLRGAMRSEIRITTAEDGKVSLRGGTTVANLHADAFTPGAQGIDEKELVLRHDLDLDEKTIDLQDVRLTAGFARAKLTGRMTLPENGGGPAGTLQIDADADLDRVMALLGDAIPATLRGQVKLVGSYASREGGADFDGTVSTAGMSVKTEALGEAPFDVGRLQARAKGTWAEGERKVTVNELAVDGDLAKIDGRLAQTLPEDGDGRLDLALKGRVDLDRLAAPFLDARPSSALARSNVDVSLSKVGELVTLERADLAAGGTTVTSKGTMRLGEGSDAGATIDYTVKGELSDLGPYLATLEKPLTARGQVDCSGRIGTGAMRVFTTKGSARGLDLSGPMMSDRRVTTGPATFDLATRGGGDTPIAVEKMVAKVQGFRQSAPQAATMEGDLDLGGSLGSDGAFAFTLKGTKMRVQPATADRALALAKPLDASAKGKREEASGRYDIDELKLSADGIEASGKGTWIPGERFDTDLVADLDGASFARSWLALWFEDVEGTGKGRVELMAKLPMGDAEKRAQSQGRLLAKLDSIRVDGFTLTDLDAQGALVDGLGELKKGDAKLNGGPAKVTGTVDLRPEAPLYSFAVDAQKVKVVKKMQPTIARVIPIFAGVGAQVESELNVKLALTGQGADSDAVKRTLTGDGTFSAAAGSVTGGPILTGIMTMLGAPGRYDFDALQTAIKVKDGAVLQEGLTIAGNVLDMKLSGKTFFDGKIDYALGVRTKPGKTKEWDKFAPLLSSDGFLPLGIGGTIDSPSPRLPDPAKLVEGAARNALEGAIKGAIKGDGKNPLGGILGGDGKNPLGGILGGDGKKEEDPKKEDSKPVNPLEGLLGGKKDGDKPVNPLEGLLGGKKKKTEEKPKTEGGSGGR
ncbi:MAG: AsmA-like C-terminal region-containing protein [Planctomycetota bacterium]